MLLMATELAIQPANLKQEGFAPPYAPSWFDHFKQWVEGLPGPYWLFYLVLGLALVLCAAIIQWTDGSLASGNFWLLHLQLAAPVALFLGLTHYLDRTASTALANIRPSFDLTDSEFTEWKYKLTTLPSRSTWLATGAGLTFVTLAYLLTPNNFQMIQAIKLSTSRQAIIFWSLMILAGWGAYAVLYYHAIHQLRLISRLYAQHIQIDLFKLNPLYSLSALTLRTAIGLVVPPYLVVLTAQPILPEVATIPEIILVLVVASVIAVLTFVLPLLSLHRRLQEEKARPRTKMHIS